MSDKEEKKIVIDEDYGLKFKPLLNLIKEKVKRVSRRREKGFVNKKSGSSIVIRENGNVNVVSSANAQYKLYHGGKTVETSHQSETITNKKNITTDSLSINNHKLNPKLYELTDMKSIYNDPKKVAGNLTMFSTVLVKAWEPTLEKYVLIRRLARVPVFSPEVAPPNIHPSLSVNTDLEEEFGEMVEVEKMSNMISDLSDEEQGDDNK